MEQRDNRRFARRVEIRFWRRGETQAHSAFTTNLSRTGLFLGTAMSLEPGERLQLEILDPEHGFLVEGVVARVHRVSSALRQIAQGGVGVQFLLPEQLIESLLPASARQTPAATRWKTAPTAAGPDGAVRPRPAETPPDSGGEAAGAAKPGGANGKIVPVSFCDPSAFLSVYHRDIQFGGLFVSTEEPGELNEVVWVDLQLPLDGARPSLAAARVVQRFEPEAAVGGGRNVLAGMALQFLEPEKVIADLKPLLPRLRG